MWQHCQRYNAIHDNYRYPFVYSMLFLYYQMLPYLTRCACLNLTSQNFPFLGEGS